MIVVMHPGAPAAHVEHVIDALSRQGFDVHRSSGEKQVVLGAIGVQPGFDVRPIEALDGVLEVHRVTQGYRFASRLWQPEDTRVQVGESRFGGGSFGVIGVRRGVGNAQGHADAEAGGVGVWFRGCRALPASAPLAIEEFPAGTHAAEVFDVSDLETTTAHLLVVGPERMGHVALLDALGRHTRPVLLYRSASATVEEWLTHADRVLTGGNRQVMLCESGIRTFETTTHRTLDLSSIPAVHARSHLPILVDPGYGTGQPRKVAAMARAAVAAGADGLVLDVHPPGTHESADVTVLLQQIQALRAALGLSSHPSDHLAS